MKYSLGTRFVLSSNQIDCANPFRPNSFEGYFEKEESVYGAVIWNGDQDQKTLYKLELEKVFICSSKNDFIPTYDPDGKIYNEGPQFGCSKPHKSIRHRILLLDRSSDSNKQTSDYGLGKKFKFEAEFLSDSLNNCTKPEKSQNYYAMDGFKFSLKNLFELENRTSKNFDHFDAEKSYLMQEGLWYVQALFVIRPLVSEKLQDKAYQRQIRHLSSISVYSLKGIYNNGTNLQTFKLVHSKKSLNHLSSLYKNSQENKSLLGNGSAAGDIYYKKMHQIFTYSDIFLKLVIPLIVLIVILSSVVTAIYCRKQAVVKILRNQRIQKYLAKEFANESTNKNSLKYMLTSKARKTFLNAANNRKSCLYNKNDINTSENGSGTNSTSDTIIASPLLEQSNSSKNTSKLNSLMMNKSQTNQVPRLNLNAQEDSNCTLQTFISSGNNSSYLSQPVSESQQKSYLTQKSSNINEHPYDDTIYQLNHNNENHEEEALNLTGENRSRKESNSKLDSIKAVFNRAKQFSPSFILNKTGLKNFHRSSGDDEKYVDDDAYTKKLNFSPNKKVITESQNPIYKYKRGKNRNNYLYFNYNNNKMNYFNGEPINDLIVADPEMIINENETNGKLMMITSTPLISEAIALSMNSSTPNQTTPVSSAAKFPTKLKRLSGTEV